jgi:uncharacterized iron-regulated membrane protein
MKMLSILHRWSGGLIGFLLVILGLSGTVLLWEGEWISLPGSKDPVIEQIGTMGRIASREAADGATRITFASDEIGLHHVAKEGGAGSYVAQDGSSVAQWSSQWERPELWLFDLHHHLFAGHNGELVAGWAGVLGLFFVITGVILWWRSRRNFEFRLWPRRFKPGPIVRQHRDLGILVSPLLLVSFITGTGMIFDDAYKAMMAPLGRGIEAGKPPEAAPDSGVPQISRMLASAKQRFPDAALRRLTTPSKPGEPWAIRMRQPFEWTPNGRTTLYFNGDGSLLRVDDPALAGKAASVMETFYPVHTAKVGGLFWKLLMTASGLGLTMLGSFAVWSFWIRRQKGRPARRASPNPVAGTA